MNEKNYTGAIPGQQKGDEITAESARIFPGPKEAISFFDLVSRRLLVPSPSPPQSTTATWSLTLRQTP